MQAITTPSQLLPLICCLMGQDIQRVKTKSIKQDLVCVRQFYAYFGKEVYNFPLRVLADELGARDHTTIVHSLKVIKNKISIKDSSTIFYLNKIMDALEINMESGHVYKNLFKQYNIVLADNESLQKQISKQSKLVENLQSQVKLIEILQGQIKMYKAKS